MTIEFLKSMSLIIPILFGIGFVVEDFKSKKTDLLNLQIKLYSKFMDIKIRNLGTKVLNTKYLNVTQSTLIDSNDRIAINNKEIFFYGAKNLFKRSEYERSIDKFEKEISTRKKIKTKK